MFAGTIGTLTEITVDEPDESDTRTAKSWVVGPERVCRCAIVGVKMNAPLAESSATWASVVR